MPCFAAFQMTPDRSKVIKFKDPIKADISNSEKKGGVFGQVDGAEMLEDQYRTMGPLFSLYGIFYHWRHREIKIGKCLWLNKLGS